MGFQRDFYLSIVMVVFDGVEYEALSSMVPSGGVWNVALSGKDRPL